MEWVALIAVAGIISYTIIRIVEIRSGATKKVDKSSSEE